MNDIYRNSIFWVEVERIKPNPFQPRRDFDQENLNSLAESIRMYGLLQPLTVTRNETTRDDGGIAVEYELIAGERRLRASKIAGLNQVPVIIRSGQDTDQMKLELAIIENLQREDLNPVDRAKAFHRLYKEFKFTHQEIGKKVGKSREYVSNTLRLLALPEYILGYISEGRIVEGHTRPLLMLNDRPEEQTVLAKEILLKRLTVRESETLARRAAQDKVTARHKIDPVILSLERKLTERLGTRVQIEPREVGGKLVISFFSADDLTALLGAMRIEEGGQEVPKVFDGNPVAPTIEMDMRRDFIQKDTVTDVGKIVVDTGEEVVEIKEDAPDTEAVFTDEVVLNAPEANELDTQAEQEIVNEIDALLGLGNEEVESQEEKGEAVTNVEEETIVAVVEPSPTMPMPEEAPSILSTPFEPRALEEEVKEEEDLYSIRNFSI